MTDKSHRSEFGLIAELLAPLAQNPAAAGLTDDAARVDVPSGHELVISTDMLLAGVHVPVPTQPEVLANRLLACNLSDLAAKGAKPYGCLLHLGVAASWDDAFLQAFIAAFGSGLKTHDLQLWGGDTVAAEQGFAGLTVHGLLPKGEMLTRSGAQDGDDVYVTGTIGEGYLGLQHALAATQGETRAAYENPQPPIIFGQNLRKLAHASIDISDGLLADLDHICRASDGMMQIEAETIPLSAEGQGAAFETLLTAGDDLQIAFTAAADKSQVLAALAAQCDIQLTRIGRFSQTDTDSENSSQSAVLRNAEGKILTPESRGYRHF